MVKGLAKWNDESGKMQSVSDLIQTRLNKISTWGVLHPTEAIKERRVDKIPTSADLSEGEGSLLRWANICIFVWRLRVLMDDIWKIPIAICLSIYWAMLPVSNIVWHKK